MEREQLMSKPPQPRINPYVGPRAFQRGETLYGRDREVMEFVDLLIAERIVLLYSPSGAGKTSLIQAALIPVLERDGFCVLPPMRVNLEPPMSGDPASGPPLNRYILSLLLSLEEVLSGDQPIPMAELMTLTLDDYLGRRQEACERGDGVVLIFDQFEEILTVDPTDRAAKSEFFAQAGTALDAGGIPGKFGSLSASCADTSEQYLSPGTPGTRGGNGRHSAAGP
jgi:hypothetical protein